MLLQGNQKYHAKELKLIVSNKTLIKSVIIIFKKLLFIFISELPSWKTNNETSHQLKYGA